jgi:hypothetical protein
MIEHLSVLITANQTRCFTHILNLVAKSILHWFEVQKRAENDEVEDYDDTSKALTALAQELDLEDHSCDLAEDPDEALGMEDEEADDDDDGLHDGESEGEEEAVFDNSLVPIWLMLTKASFFELSQTLSDTFLVLISFAHLQMQSRTHPQ